MDEDLQKIDKAIDEAKENFGDGIYQAIEALDELQKLSGESCLKADFRVRTLALKGILRDTNWNISDLKRVVQEEVEVV